MGKNIDFDSLDIDALETMPTQNNSEITAEKPAEIQADPQPAPRTFKPAESPNFSSEDVSPIDTNEMFSFAEEKFSELIEKKRAGKIPEKGEIVEQKTDDLMSPEMVEVSAVMYVQLLEGVVNAVCSWYSGVTGASYDFEKKMRERYERITAMYFQAQNIRLTPSHFFALMTVFLLFGSGYKAHTDRRRRLTAESFAKKSNRINDKRAPGEQATLFETESVLGERKNFAAKRDSDTGKIYYEFHPVERVYAKKGEREEVPPHLSTFLFDFKNRNSKWPNKAQVDTFLKS